MRIIARSMLRAFWERAPQFADSKGPLEAWFAEVRKAAWTSPAQVKVEYRNASILKSGRVVFNIAGNKSRLAVHIRYDLGILFIRFIGTHT